MSPSPSDIFMMRKPFVTGEVLYRIKISRHPFKKIDFQFYSRSLLLFVAVVATSNLAYWPRSKISEEVLFPLTNNLETRERFFHDILTRGQKQWDDKSKEMSDEFAMVAMGYGGLHLRHCTFLQHRTPCMKDFTSVRGFYFPPHDSGIILALSVAFITAVCPAFSYRSWWRAWEGRGARGGYGLRCEEGALEGELQAVQETRV